MTLKELRAGLVAFTKLPTPKYKAVTQCWEGFEHSITLNERKGGEA